MKTILLLAALITPSTEKAPTLVAKQNSDRAECRYMGKLILKSQATLSELLVRSYLAPLCKGPKNQVFTQV